MAWSGCALMRRPQESDEERGGEIAAAELDAHGERIAVPQPAREPRSELDDDGAFAAQARALDAGRRKRARAMSASVLSSRRSITARSPATSAAR